MGGHLRRLLWVALFVVFAQAPVALGQVIDRMLAVVDGEVVTQSDIEDYRVLARGFGDEPPDDDQVVLNQIIEDMLISRQISQFPGNEITGPELDAYVADFQDAGDLSPERLRTLARRRLELERYYASLAQSLRASDEEVQELYDNEFLPQLRATGEEVIPTLDELRPQLQEIVLADKLVEAISTRIEILRRRYRVDIVE